MCTRWCRWQHEDARTAWTTAASSWLGSPRVVDNLGDIDARELNARPISDTVTLRVGKYGPYLEVIDPANPTA